MPCVGTVTVVTKARVTPVAAATALVIGSVGVVLAVNSGRPEASNKCCIETATATGCFSVPATDKGAGG